jgi:hypothetical protein
LANAPFGARQPLPVGLGAGAGAGVAFEQKRPFASRQGVGFVAGAGAGLAGAGVGAAFEQKWPLASRHGVAFAVGVGFAAGLAANDGMANIMAPATMVEPIMVLRIMCFPSGRQIDLARMLCATRARFNGVVAPAA